MSTEVSKDQLVLIRIEGMHCHRCEQSISRALSAFPGVYEVEVDFNAKLASVLFDDSQVHIPRLTRAVEEAGYQVASFTQRQAG